jgi:hypothetical protein
MDESALTAKRLTISVSVAIYSDPSDSPMSQSYGLKLPLFRCATTLVLISETYCAASPRVRIAWTRAKIACFCAGGDMAKS